MVGWALSMRTRAAVATAFAAPLVLSAGSVSAPARRPTASHAELELCFASGAATYFCGGRFVRQPAGTLAVFWAGLPHCLLELEAESELIHLELPLSVLWRLQLGGAFARKVLAGELVIDSQSPAWDCEVARRWLEDMAGGEASALRAGELEIEARLRRLAARRQRAAKRAPLQPARRQVEMIAAFLSRNYRSDISSADVGRAVGLHPNYVMTLFRREAGLSLWQFLTRRRLAHAQELLLTSEKPVLAIALESGFGSLARFYAAFTREHGVAPGELRKRA